MSGNDRDPTEGLPPDLARVLRDQSVIVPQDASVFELIAKWRNAPSNTASGSGDPDVDESRTRSGPESAEPHG